MTLLLTVFSCRQEDTLPDAPETPTSYIDDWLIVGTSYGECLGDCITLYKITRQQIYQDTMERFEEGPLTFATTPLPPEKFALAAPLLQSFPEELLQSEQQVYGQPDARDQGTILVIASREGRIYERYLDPDEENLPAWLLPYVQQLKEVLNELNN